MNIINQNNIFYLVVEQLKDLGPEPHYRCLCGNEEIILAKQSSGLYVKYNDIKEWAIYSIIDIYLPHRENNLPAQYFKQQQSKYYYKFGKFHRLDGPAYEQPKLRTSNVWQEKEEQYYIDGIKYKSKKEYKKAIKDYVKTIGKS